MNLVRKLVSSTVRAAAGYPGRCVCIFCGRRLTRFLPYVSTGWRPFKVPPLMQALNLVGSDTTRFSCPHCLSHDRERHLWLYLQACGIAETISALRILHIAPEPNLASRIETQRPAIYVRGDFSPTAPNILRIDVMAIPFPEAYFDLVIANHVLEHVADDLMALREVTRVLAPGGYAILQTPYAALLETTWSDPGVRTPNARLHAFGQEDHVRLYGRDIFSRIASVGLLDRTQTHGQSLATADPSRLGINPVEPLFLFQKPLSAHVAPRSTQ